jgi:hypothetical protein
MTTHHPHRPARIAAASLAALALTAPVAGARPAIDPSGHAGAHSLPAPTVIRPADSGFEWASGAIGAGAATVVLLIAAGGATTVSRRQHHDTTLGTAA